MEKIEFKARVLACSYYNILQLEMLNSNHWIKLRNENKEITVTIEEFKEKENNKKED